MRQDNKGILCTVTLIENDFLITSPTGTTVQIEEVKNLTPEATNIFRVIKKMKADKGFLNKNGQIVVGFTKIEMEQILKISKVVK